MRGNRDTFSEENGGNRSIPACAGEPASTTCPAIYGQVYPRVCGGTDVPSYDVLMAGGLSPRVRGNLTPDGYGVWGFRSIPACAGEPGVMCQALLEGKVYPRVCGGTGWW